MEPEEEKKGILGADRTEAPLFPSGMNAAFFFSFHY